LKRLELEIPIDIKLSLYPSFISFLFNMYDNKLVKVYGAGKNCKIIVNRNGREITYSEECEPFISEWMGLWFNPYDYLSKVKRSKRYIVERIIECYERLRLMVSSYDRDFVFIATFLSRRANYHVSVIKWVRKILELSKENIDNIQSMNMRAVGSSYQLKQLSEIIPSYIELRRTLRNVSPWSERAALMDLKYVGPKVIDAYLLFTCRGSIFTPSDVHYQRVSRYLELMDKEIIVPSKNMCLLNKAFCIDCKFKDKCLTGSSIQLYGPLSGWIQTVSYVHDKLYCSRNECSNCPLKNICTR